MTDFIGSRKTPTNDNRWRRNNRGRNQRPSNAPKQVNKASSWDKPNAASQPAVSEKSPMKQDSNDWEQPSGALATPADASTNPWATDPAPVDANWGDMASCLIPAPQEEEWVYQDPNAPLELNSLNLAAYCSPVDDWNTIITNAKQYHQLKRQERVTKWVMGGTEEEDPPNLKVKGVRQIWKPFSNRSPHALPGAYS